MFVFQNKNLPIARLISFKKLLLQTGISIGVFDIFVFLINANIWRKNLRNFIFLNNQIFNSWGKMFKELRGIKPKV